MHFSGDFAANSLQTKDVQAYLAHALHAPPVEKLLEEKFVATYRQVGQPACFTLSLPTRGTPKQTPPEYGIAYVCTPDGQVVHFIPGFLPSAVLLEELAWAERQYQEIAAVSSAEQTELLRKAHRARLTAENALYFASLLPPAERQGKESSDAAALSKYILACRQTRNWQSAKRFGLKADDEDGGKLLAALAAHGDLDETSASLILSEYPLIPLSRLQRPAFTILCGGRFWETTAARDEWKRQFLAALERQQNVVVVIARDADWSGASPPEADPLTWPPKNSAVQAELAKTEVLRMSLDEYATLITDAKLEPVAAKAADLPRIALHGPKGKRVAIMTEKDSFSRLPLALQRLSDGGKPAPSKEKKSPPSVTKDTGP